MDTTLGKNVTKIVTPKVLSKARKFFGCEELDGVELEDDEYAGSHWESRLLFAEFMSSSIGLTAVSHVSSMSLALLEDTGFSTANYGVAQDAGMRWGNKAGCAFVQQKCKSPLQTTGDFCFDQNSTNVYCTQDYLATARPSNRTLSTSVIPTLKA